MAGRVVRRLGWVLAALVAVALFVRVFVVGLYYVDSGSMEPTVHGSEEGGEFLAVRYGGGLELERFDLVALLPGGGESEPRVKRVVGLMGEKLAVRGGDLWIDGELLPPEAPRPPLVLIFDDALLDVESWFRFTDAWSYDGRELRLEGQSVEPGMGRGLLYMRQVLKDHYLDAEGRLVPGEVVVGDAALELEVRLDEPPATLRLGLSEQGDVFEARIEPTGERARVQLLRRNAQGLEVLAQAEFPWGPGFHTLSWCNRDDYLRLVLDGREELGVSYDGNTFLPSDHAKHGLSAPTERVFFGGETGDATFRRVRVLRDLHYTPRGEFGVSGEVWLGPDEIFVLGDNSRESRDGRDWGPTPLDEVLGRPLGVVWPLSQARPLERATER